MLMEDVMEYEKIILDLLNRIVTLEGKVAQLESERTVVKSEPVRPSEPRRSLSNQRDMTKYLFEGKLYGKSRLVLAVVRKYVETHPNIKVRDLEITFDKSLQGSLGVVRELEEVKMNVSDYSKRFFIKPQEEIRLIDGTCVVCTQWGIGNIDWIVDYAVEDLGYEIRKTN